MNPMDVSGEDRVDYGRQIVSTLSTQLVQAYEQSFGLRSLRRLVQLARRWQVRQALGALPDSKEQT